MKNLKICKRSLALTTALGITLFSGCSKHNDDKSIDTKEEKTFCEHLIVNFGAQSVIFKECEGYNVFFNRSKGSTYYEVSQDNNLLISGYTYSVNYYTTTHEAIDEIEEMAIEKGAYVYKTNN